MASCAAGAKSIVSVSESKVSEVSAYIAGQPEHHRLRTFTEEFQEFAEKHGLEWHEP